MIWATRSNIFKSPSFSQNRAKVYQIVHDISKHLGKAGPVFMVLLLFPLKPIAELRWISMEAELGFMFIIKPEASEIIVIFPRKDA